MAVWICWAGWQEYQPVSILGIRPMMMHLRRVKEAFRDVGISAASGFVTGAFGAKFPGAHRLAEGVVDTAVSAGERYLYAVFDDSMSWEEKRA